MAVAPSPIRAAPCTTLQTAASRARVRRRLLPWRARPFDEQSINRRCIQAVAAHAGLDVAVVQVAGAAAPGFAGPTHPLQVPVGRREGTLYVSGVEADLPQPPRHELARARVAAAEGAQINVA